MKTKFISILMFAMTFAFISCGPMSKEKAIIGKWKFDRLTVSESQSKQMTEQDKLSLPIAESMFQESTLEFFKDKTMESSQSDKSLRTGTYEFINDSKYIICKLQNEYGELETMKFLIVDLTKESITLQTDEGLNMCYKKI